ncbi:hypothetical protein IE53DRAFT_111585 [Violaceomyces palustris]|uniref:Uncharacterized protein n=1 Tax=Violaceomyces palustris TaxID=1673888 RepID=A0ACD0NW34_9BASI|nr:hypothetical protein IE53DRAFT_111585 [Violaceomyces palustris]
MSFLFDPSPFLPQPFFPDRQSMPHCNVQHLPIRPSNGNPSEISNSSHETRPKKHEGGNGFFICFCVCVWEGGATRFVFTKIVTKRRGWGRLVSGLRVMV